jgi:hypothetical protein
MISKQIVTEQLQNLQTERDEDGSDITRMISEGEERIVFFGTLERKSRERGVLIRYNTDNTLLACQSAGEFVPSFFLFALWLSSKKVHIQFNNVSVSVSVSMSVC